MVIQSASSGIVGQFRWRPLAKKYLKTIVLATLPIISYYGKLMNVQKNPFFSVVLSIKTN